MLIEIASATAVGAPVLAAEPVRRRWLRLLPGLVVLAGVVLVLRHSGVGLHLQARFAAHLLGVVLAPGVLVWRGLRKRSGSLPFDLVGGATVGYAMEIGWYLIGRAVGEPFLHVIAAGVVVASFGAVPRLRRHFSEGGPPTDVRWAWSVVALCLLMLWWSAVTYLDPHALTWPGYGDPYQDMVFHQALVGELRHHLPAQSPSVAGVPLSYHWFVHAEWAAVSWSTGIEPAMLTYRLGLMPTVVLLVVAIAVVAQRVLPGHWWSGPLTVVLALFALAPDPAAWSLTAVPAADIPGTMWLSPTQTFGGLLFAGAVLTLADLLSRDEPAGLWVAFALAIAATTGAKATYAPLLLTGLGAVVGAGLLRRRISRRIRRRASAAAGITLVVFGIAALTVFPGTSGGIFFDPLASLTGSLRPGWTVAHGLAIWALGWSAILAAVVVLARRRYWTDPMLMLCAGIGAAGLAVVLLVRQMGSSQMYFLVSARPYVALLVVAALGRAVSARLVLPAALFGGAVTVLGETISPARSPREGTVAILWPYVLPLLTATALGLLAWMTRRTRPFALVVAGAVLIGAVVPTAIDYGRYVRTRNITAAGGSTPAGDQPPIPRGAPQAGRWLRAHTGTGDLLATNNHCRRTGAMCDPRQFWLAAYAERRVLVEGWAFTPPANAVAGRDRLRSDRIPYWDPARLADNDAAFLRPSAATVGLLQTRYEVKWLVVDIRRPYDRVALSRAATLRHRSGQVAVYQISGP